MQSENFLKVFKGAEPLLELSKGSVLFVCGAGGKTSMIHALAAWYRERGDTVILTTSTHMMREEPLCDSYNAALHSLEMTGYAAVGRTDPYHSEKMIGLDESERKRIVKAADIVLVEADGARHQSVKVPYGHEPVIYAEATRIAVLYRSDAAGQKIRDAVYNPEGMIEILRSMGYQADLNSVLTEEMIRNAVEIGYRERFAEMNCSKQFDLIDSHAGGEQWII